MKRMTQQLSTWDSAKQAAYRGQHSAASPTFHFLLDASPSMIGDYEMQLRASFNMYLAWLKRQASPLSLAEVHCFSTNFTRGPLQPLGMLRPLTPQTYNPHKGDGTALYRALGETCTTTPQAGFHLLCVYTDGRDNRSNEFSWTADKVAAILLTLQQNAAWCGVFLGAFPQALEVGRTCGFTAGNCLQFSSDRIPDAFRRLTDATQRYLGASPQDKKQLAATGVWSAKEHV